MKFKYKGPRSLGSRGCRSVTQKSLRSTELKKQILTGKVAHAAPPIFFDRRHAAADRNWPERRRRHNDVGAQLYILLLDRGRG